MSSCKICSKTVKSSDAFSIGGEIFCTIEHLQTWKKAVFDPAEKQKHPPAYWLPTERQARPEMFFTRGK
jgi:hypothetical protein